MIGASGGPLRSDGFTPVASVYILVVAVTATAGFSTDSTKLILLAAVLGLPASILALPGYYVMYGVLALVPGANPSSSSGSGYCTPDGRCHETETGEPATWFLATTDILGIVALTTAALLNVVLIHSQQTHRLFRDSCSHGEQERTVAS